MELVCFKIIFIIQKYIFKLPFIELVYHGCYYMEEPDKTFTTDSVIECANLCEEYSFISINNGFGFKIKFKYLNF